MDENEKGYVTLLLLILIAFGFLLSGGLMPLLQQPPANATGYSLINPPVSSSSSTLQLQSLNFVLGACDPGYLESGEPGILYAAKPGPNDIASATDTIKLWYSDEHALTLGVGAISPMVNHPVDQIANPQVGDTTQRDPYGFPQFPALFIVDVTFDPKNTVGDAQHGGIPIPPSIVYGTWKAANAADPPANGWNVGAGDPFPSQPTNIQHSGTTRIENEYGAEIEWNISSLNLAPGHSYKAQFVVHDGDSNRAGGDIGIGCTTVRM